MNAIIPLNIKALRVSTRDADTVTSDFKGRMGRFENIPYSGSSGTSASDHVIEPLESDNHPLSSLQAGIHLHWELPDYFKKGVQSSEGKKVRFPQAPNRWLVIRYLKLGYDYSKENRNEWEPGFRFHSWIVESDFISETPVIDSDGITRPSVSVPLPVKPLQGGQPFRYMGRVSDASTWQGPSPQDQYLRDFQNADGTPCSLNALGFLGPAFSSYYPDCCSVFGFWDTFKDDPEIFYNLIHHQGYYTSYPHRLFKVNYHVIGWIDGEDPFDNIQQEYTAYLQTYNGSSPQTYNDFFIAYALENLGWEFNENAIRIGGTPGKTICNGILQEIIWNVNEANSAGFLRKGDAYDAYVDNTIRLAIGNTSSEALSALLKSDSSGNGQESNHEYLLNMLQSGRIEAMDNGNNNLISLLEEGFHSDTFFGEQGGLLWTVQSKANPGGGSQNVKAPGISPELAVELNLLNQAQKAYDMARQALSVERKQLYMDWRRYMKIYSGEETSPNVDLKTLEDYIRESSNTIINKARDTGILTYYSNNNNQNINGIQQPVNNNSKAYQTYSRFEACHTLIASSSEWELLAISAPAYRHPADLVLAMETSELSTEKRNGKSVNIPVRTSWEIINTLLFKYDGVKQELKASDIPSIPIINNILYPFLPYGAEIDFLIKEANLLISSLAEGVLTTLRDMGVVNYFDRMLEAYRSLLGGFSPLEYHENNEGLFETVREEGYIAEANPMLSVSSPMEISVIFTNGYGLAILPNPVGWNKQEQYAFLDESHRYDPFMPMSLIWKLDFTFLKQGNMYNYAYNDIIQHFTFNNEGTDYMYNLSFPGIENIDYKGSSELNINTIQSLTHSIRKYAASGEEDTSESESDLEMILRNFEDRKIISVTLGSFYPNQILRDPVQGMNIVNLYGGGAVTDNVWNAIYSDSNDNNPDQSFNTEMPIYKGLLAKYNFGPLRSGFLSVTNLEIVDIFGQRMCLSTPKKDTSGALLLKPSLSLSPKPEDTLYNNRAYLPPRLLTPARMFFRWLHATPSGTENSILESIELDPQSSVLPVCGWVLPNNLDGCLFFYDSDGKDIGSFGLELGKLKYRTKVGNNYNPNDSLEVDIGTQANPKVNVHLARFMRYIQSKSNAGKNNGGFIDDLMQTILHSQNLIATTNGSVNGALTILTGSPLALVRSVISMESYGGLLPLNQADTKDESPWPQDVLNHRYVYHDRMEHSSANLGSVEFPLRLGNLYNTADGMIGYIKESDNPANPYGNADFYALAASGQGQNGIVRPSDTDIRLKLNADPEILTMLVDPRAAVHAVTGILPVEKLAIPQEQFEKVVKNIQVTFFTNPLLKQKDGFMVPVLEQDGYTWSWLTQGSEMPLTVASSSDSASWGYSPQTLEEGWLKLSPNTEQLQDEGNTE